MPELTETTESQFKPGEVWSYATRAGEEKSFLIVLKTEKADKTDGVVHIYIEGVRMKKTGEPGDAPFGSLIHLPFAEEALKKSVSKKVGAAKELPPYENAYKAWKAQFEAGKAGVFTNSVAQAIDFIVEMVHKKA